MEEVNGERTTNCSPNGRGKSKDMTSDNKKKKRKNGRKKEKRYLHIPGIEVFAYTNVFIVNETGFGTSKRCEKSGRAHVVARASCTF